MSLQFPIELLPQVFYALPPPDLDNCKLVCRLWSEIIDDSVWQDQFNKKFGTLKHTQVSQITTEWRKELLNRVLILKKWEKCSKTVDITFNSSLVEISRIYPDFQSSSPRLVCFNTHKGMGIIFDLESGKTRRKLYSSAFSRDYQPVSVVDCSRFGMIFGFYDGKVACVSFTKDGTSVGEFKDLEYRHFSSINACWITKSRNFDKDMLGYVNLASGSMDGTVYLAFKGHHQRVKPSSIPIVLLEGTANGSYSAGDGEYIICIDQLGSVFKLKPHSASGSAAPSGGTADYNNDVESSSIQVTTLTKLPFDLDTAQFGVTLNIVNDYAVVQTRTHVFAIDLRHGSTTLVYSNTEVYISAFAIDTSNVVGYKHLVIGLANNELICFCLPERGGIHDVIEEGISKTWEQQSPLNYNPVLESNHKPQITQLAMNSAVLLVGGYNGEVKAVDLLTGKKLKNVNSRISRNVLDYNLYSADGLVPVTHLKIDSNPLRPRAVIAVRPAVQAFDLGPVQKPEKHVSPYLKHQPKHRSSKQHSATNLRHDLDEEIELSSEYHAASRARIERDLSLAADFSMEDMDEEEQMEYALMLSESGDRERNNELTSSAEMDPDEQLRLALEMSMIDSSTTDADTTHQNDEDATALQNSEGENTVTSNTDANNEDIVNLDDIDIEEQIRIAIELSRQSM